MSEEIKKIDGVNPSGGEIDIAATVKSELDANIGSLVKAEILKQQEKITLEVKNALEKLEISSKNNSTDLMQQNKKQDKQILNIKDFKI